MAIGEYTVFLLNDGTVKLCGYNTQGQLGLGDTTNRTTPTVIPNLNDIIKLWDMPLSICVYKIYKTLTNAIYGKK